MHLGKVTICGERFPAGDRYPFRLEILRRTSSLTFDGPVTMFVGENGTGKSTLLEALAVACGIHIWQYREGGVAYGEALAPFLKVEWTDGSVPGAFFGSDIFRDFTEILDEWAATDPGQLKYFGGRSLTTQSHGQSIMAYFRSRFLRKGLYLLDEPETALSPRSQLDLLGFLEAMTRDGHAQFIIATHSPMILACPGARLYGFDRIPIAPVAYRETTHYRIYRDFIEKQK